MAAGIVGALLAAVPGFLDLSSIHEPKLRRIGIIHMTINLVIVGLFVINWAMRFTQAADSTMPMILSLIGVVLLIVAGWLGAELVHGYRVGVDEPGEKHAS